MRRKILANAALRAEKDGKTPNLRDAIELNAIMKPYRQPWNHIGLLLVAAVTPVSSASFSLSIPGISNPWLAGMPPGSRASGTDSAPAHSPVLVAGLTVTRGVAYTFDASGEVGNTAIPPAYPPEGNLLHIPAHGAGAENGIASASLPMNSLVGVFLGSDWPDMTEPPPPLDFSTAEARDYESLRPALKQVFYIGDGRTSSGALQIVLPPPGATRLFLGTMDIWTSGDNVGAFSVIVTETNAPVSPSDTFDALADFGPLQGGTRGTWRYQEFDGTAFSDLTFEAGGNSFSGFQAAYTGRGSALPLLFADSATPDGLVFHPGNPGSGPQPIRRDIALVWVAPSNGFYSIRGFVRGDSRFGIGGDGFVYSLFREEEQLLRREITFNDKSNQSIFLRHLYVTNGSRLSLRIFDKGNNEYDPGVFNLIIRPEEAGLRIRTSQVELCWDAEPNVVYQVEYRSALTTNVWLPFDTNRFIGDGTVKCVHDAVPLDQPQKFYRVVKNP